WFYLSLLRESGVTLVPFAKDKKFLEERLNLLFRSLEERWEEKDGTNYQRIWVERVFPQLRSEISLEELHGVFSWQDGMQLCLQMRDKAYRIYQLGGLTDLQQIPLMVGEFGDLVMKEGEDWLRSPELQL